MPNISEDSGSFPPVPLIEAGDAVIGGSESSGPNKALNALTDRSAYNKRLIEDIQSNSTNLIIGSDVQAWDEDLDAVAALAGNGLVRRTGNGTAEIVTSWVDPGVAGGRLSLTAGDSFSSGDVIDANRIYYTPHVSATIALRSGNEWKLTPFIESSASIGTLQADTNHDVFLYLNGASLAFELQPWTNDTTRSVALIRQNGVWCKSGDTTRRYVGSIRTGTAGTCTSSEERRHVFNANNRLPHTLRRQPVANSWNAVGTNWRAANGNNSNRVQLICGLRETMADLAIVGIAGTNAKMGISINTVGTANRDFGIGLSDANQSTTIAAIYREVPRLGHSFYQLVEQSQDGTSGFDGENTALSGIWWC